ncbi:MAG: type III glutamate--ammonia ligase [Armatimonadota bacterium]
MASQLEKPTICENMIEYENLQKKIEEDKIQYILVQFVDIHGSAKVKMVPARCLDDICTDGAGFAGGAVWGMGQKAHNHDMMGKADPASYTPLPWEPGVARLAADIYVDGEVHPYCPRVNLKRVLGELREMGYIYNVGIEPEFFLVRKNEKGGIDIADDLGIDTLAKPCYDFKGIHQHMGFLRELNDTIDALGWGNYQTDHEDANGQYELNYTYSDALTAADRHTFVKMTTSQIARRHGLIATHMAKPFANRTGSGAHFHFSMADAETGENVFLGSGNDMKGLGHSDLAYYFIGGILKHARAITAITSPTVNCYKRIQVGPALTGSASGYTWTPAFIAYGDNNRTLMLRTPAPGRFEDRTVSAAANPYLAIAVQVAAGIDGIKNKIDPGEPFIGVNLYDMSLDELAAKGIHTLPQSLPEALEELKKDDVIKAALGDICDEFIRIKEGEWREYHRKVSEWEVERYLTMF